MMQKRLGISGKLVKEIMQDENFRRLRACIQCGECTAGCPSALYTPLRVRMIMRKVLTGIENVLSDLDIWECVCCYSCLERCTRHIPVTEVIYQLRNMAVRGGYLIEPFKILLKNLIETGQAVPIGGKYSKWTQLRKLLELDSFTPNCNLSQKGQTELDILFDRIGFYQRIPFRKF